MDPSTIAAAVAELQAEGLAQVQISARLGLTATQVKEAVREAKQPDHGLPERWYRGCRCDACAQAIRTDPVVRQVGQLRGDGLIYTKIAEQLGIPLLLAEKAGHASGVKKGIPHGQAARWRAGCRCEACTEAGEKEASAAQAELQRRRDLAANRLAKFLQAQNGPAKQDRVKKRRVKTHIHGTPVRWRAGCRCQACVTAVRQDPLILQVAELRNTGLEYKEIAAQLEISVAKAQEAGLAAGFKGSGGPTSVAPPPCSWPACDSPALTGVRCAFHQDWAKRGFGPDNPATKDDFPSELRAAIILKAVELLLGGLPYSDVGTRLGITAKIAETVCRDAGYTDVPRRPASNEAVVTFPRRSEKWNLAAPAGSGNVRRRPAANKAAVTFPRRSKKWDVAASARSTDTLRRSATNDGTEPIWRHGEEWDRLVASAGVLLGEGFTTAEIAARLGISYGSAAKACRLSAELSKVHGVPVTWHTGCRCETCLEAMRRDPFIASVAEKRSRNVPYKDISVYLGSTPARIRRAAQEAGDCGLIDGIRAQRAAAVTSATQRVPIDGFTSEAWAELVDAVRELRGSGVRDAAIGRRLGVSTRVVKTAAKEADVVGNHSGHAGDDAGVTSEDHQSSEAVSAEPAALLAYPKPLSEFTLLEDGVGWISLDNYVQMSTPKDATPEVHVRTPEEWAELVQSVGELRQAGLSIKKISLRLGIPPATATDACEESSFDGKPARPPHGTRSRWKTGCSCVLCTEGKEADPLIAEVGKLRAERLSYPKIATTLGISPARAWQAGRDAGFTGWPEQPADVPSPREKAVAKRAEDRTSAGAHSQPWTETDEQTVMGSDLSPTELAAVLGRTPSSIYNKRQELSANGGKPRTKRLRRLWSTEDDEVMMREDLTLQEKADKLGRPYAAVSNRRHHLRKAATPKPPAPAEQKRRPWTPEDLATARRGDIPVKELAAMLGRSPASVYGVRHRA